MVGWRCRGDPEAPRGTLAVTYHGGRVVPLGFVRSESVAERDGVIFRGLPAAWAVRATLPVRVASERRQARMRCGSP